MHGQDYKEAILLPELAQEPDVPLPEAPQMESPESDEPEDIELYHFIQVVRAMEKESISASEPEDSERDSVANPSEPVDYGRPSRYNYHYSSPAKGYTNYYDIPPTSTYGNDFAYYAPQEQYHVTPRRRHGRKLNYTPKSYEAVPEYSSLPPYSGPDYYYYDQPLKIPKRTRKRRTPTTEPPKKPSKSTDTKAPLKATEDDAIRMGIPAGYSIKNWDPTEVPIMILGSVFDANSLGKWIYDWTVYHHGSATPMADVAGDLWLLLIKLAGKIKRAQECIPRIRSMENKEMVEDFIESGSRIWGKLKKLLKSCEHYMWRVARREAKDGEAKEGEAREGGSNEEEGKANQKDRESKEGEVTEGDDKEGEGETIKRHQKKGLSMGKKAGTEFVDSIFGRDRELETTEKLMNTIRLWDMRFDANCAEILQRPSAA